VDAVARTMTPKTRVVAVTNLCNPIGVRATDDSLRALAKVAASRGAWLLVDEVYAPFDALVAADGTWRATARHLAPNVVTVSSLTKCYGVGDHRVGWVYGPADVIARAEDAITSNMGHTPLVWASFASHAFDRVADLAERAKKNLEGKRARVAAWVASRKDLRWSAPTEGLFGFATDVSGRDLTDVIERGIAEHDVIVGPGKFFGVPSGFRLAWSIDREKLDEGLSRLSRVLDAR
jgi:aspartate/methionine/tyrosine aminotransferase